MVPKSTYKYQTLCGFKGTSGGLRHCIWTPDCPLKFSCYLALDRPTGIHIVILLKNVLVSGDYKHMSLETACFHGYWNTASGTPTLKEKSGA